MVVRATEWISGPTLPVLDRIGLDADEIVVSTGSYSRRPLEWFCNKISCHSFKFMGRLDITNLDEWVQGFIDPKALLQKTFLTFLNLFHLS